MALSKVVSLKLERTSYAALLNESRKKEELTDVHLQIGDKLFPAHRIILSLYSPVLKAAISDQWSSSKVCSISGEYVDPSIVEELLHFLYTGSIDLTPDNVHPVCVAAHFLQIATLLEPAVQHLCQLISVDNVLTLFEFSLNAQLERLRESCLKFIAKNSSQVFQDSQMLKFSAKNFKDLIAGLRDQHWNPRSNLRVNTFNAIVRWTKANLERLDELPGLLKSIPLEELPQDFLTGTVAKHPLVKGSASGKETVSAARENYKAVLKSGWRLSKNLLIFGREKTGPIDETATPSPSFKCHDLLNGCSIKIPDMHEARFVFNYTVINRHDIVVAGGLKLHARKNPRKNLTSVEMFVWASKTWKKLAPLPDINEWVNYSVATIDGKLYAAAWMLSGHGNLSDLPFFRYSFTNRKWKPLSPLNIHRSEFQLVGYGNHLYAFGGNTNAVEKYDPETDQWSVLEQPAITDQMFGTAVLHGKIYTTGKLKELLMFDPETGIWSKLNDYCENNSIAAIDDQLLIIDRDDDISEFDFENRKWKKVFKPEYSPSFMVAGTFY